MCERIASLSLRNCSCMRDSDSRCHQLQSETRGNATHGRALPSPSQVPGTHAEPSSVQVRDQSVVPSPTATRPVPNYHLGRVPTSQTSTADPVLTYNTCHSLSCPICCRHTYLFLGTPEEVLDGALTLARVRDKSVNHPVELLRGTAGLR